MGNKELNIQHGGDIDLAIKKYGGQRADWIDPVSYTHLTLPTNREV